MTYSYLDKLSQIIQSGHNYIEVTIVDARGSIPQEVGAKMFFAGGEIIWGTVGGGRVEAAAITKCKELLASNESTELVRWNLQKDIGMTCGGEVSLFFQKFGAASSFKVAVFGAGHVSQALCEHLSRLDVTVDCFDEREEWISKLKKSANIKAHVTSDMQAQIEGLSTDTFIICMTMGHRTDMPILTRALKRDFPYVGVIGSEAKKKTLLKELQEAGVSEVQLEKLICPIGMPFGKNTPEEISISILAQILTVRDSYLV